MNVLFYMKLALAVAAVVVGIVAVIVSPTFLGTVALLTALYAAALIAAFPASYESLFAKEPIVWIPGIAIVSLSVIAVFTSSFSTDSCYIRVSPRLLTSFMEVTANPFQPLSGSERQLAEAGLNACALEPTREHQRIAIEALKAREIGPVATTGLNAIAWDVSSPKSLCVSIYRQLKSERSDLFVAHQHELRCLEENDF